jgi:hypothetical protein
MTPPNANSAALEWLGDEIGHVLIPLLEPSAPR